VFASAVIGAAVLGWRYAEASKPLTGPIVLISIDTLRADHLAAYGYRRGATPQLDRLASEGILFERAYAHAPLTLPSHASMLTGRLPFEHGVRDNAGFSLDGRHPTLGALLGSRGFDTAAAVSSYLLRETTGLARGFGAYDATLSGPAPDSTVPMVERSGTATVAAAERWIDEQRSSRFFYFLHLVEPHRPYAPPEGSTAADPYDAEVSAADGLVGRFLGALQRRGFYDQSLIIVTSDHGEGLGDHGEREHGLFLYDATIRVPLIVKLPGVIEARRIAAPVQHIDLVPTILDLVRAPAPSGLRGRSLRALLEDRNEASLQPTPIYSEAAYGFYQFGWAPLVALTEGTLRYIQAPRPELYDLETDPGEARNLAAERADTTARVAAALERLAGDARFEPPREVSRADREALAALGHVGVERRWSLPAPGSAGADPKDMVSALVAFRRGMELAGGRRHLEAIEALKALATKRSDMRRVWHEIGKLELRAGRTDEALAAFKRFATLEPDDARGPLGVGGVQARLGRFEDAAKQGALALALAVTTADTVSVPDAYDLGIRAAFGRKDTVTARALAVRAQEADALPGFEPYVEARLLHDRGDMEEATPLFEKAAEATRNRPATITELHWYRGDTFARLERYPEAERAFQREIELSPLNTRAYSSLAMLYRASHRDEKAAETLDALVRAVPTAEGYSIAARLWAVLGDRERADQLKKNIH
jgi:arylsulfatase A-like enzyme/Flp pilus assembly protein TadD